MPGDFFVTLHDESVSPLPPAHWETQPAQHCCARTPLTTLTSPPTIRLVFLDTLPGPRNQKRHSSLFGFGNTHTTDPSPTEKNTSPQVFWDPIRDMTCDLRPGDQRRPHGRGVSPILKARLRPMAFVCQTLPLYLTYGHINLRAPLPVRSAKLSRFESG